MQEIHLKDLLEAGCHFGHEVKRWHPKAAQFIYTARDGIHIIDLAKTKSYLEKAGEFAKKIGLENKTLLFVGTKRQAKNIILQEAKRVETAYFYQRWVGGFITNWSEIKKNIDGLNKMIKDKEEGKWKKFPKHEQVKLDRQRGRLEKFYGGVKHLTELPNCLFIVDVRKESTSVAESLKQNIPIIGIVDTNSNPHDINYPIPANDDAVKSISYIVTYIANCYLEGREEAEKKSRSQKALKKSEGTGSAVSSMPSVIKVSASSVISKDQKIKPARNASQSDAGEGVSVQKKSKTKKTKSKKTE